MSCSDRSMANSTCSTRVSTRSVLSRTGSEQSDPGHVQTRQVSDVAGSYEKGRCKSHTQSEAQGSNEERLKQDHSENAAVAQAHRLERSELFETFDDEQVQRLSGDRGADNETECDGDAKVHWNAGRAKK